MRSRIASFASCATYPERVPVKAVGGGSQVIAVGTPFLARGRWRLPRPHIQRRVGVRQNLAEQPNSASDRTCGHRRAVRHPYLCRHNYRSRRPFCLSSTLLRWVQLPRIGDFARQELLTCFFRNEISVGLRPPWSMARHLHAVPAKGRTSTTLVHGGLGWLAYLKSRTQGDDPAAQEAACRHPDAPPCRRRAHPSVGRDQENATPAISRRRNSR